VDTERVEVDPDSLRRLVRALRAEADGKALVRDLVEELRAVAQPALEATKASILSMDSQAEVIPGLRAAVARATSISVHTTGRGAGVAIRASKAGMPRGFRNAPRWLNRPGWRHPLFGDRDRWYSQVGKPDWFDGAIRPFVPATNRAAAEALNRVAKRIDHTTRG